MLELLIGMPASLMLGLLANLLYSLLRKLKRSNTQRESDKTYSENSFSDLVGTIFAGRESETYSERLSELLSNLTRASSEVDKVIGEITEIAHEKSETLQKFENDLASMEIREKELKDTIEALKNVPVPVAEHFAKLVRSGEKRSARRDYILFGSGVIVTTIIAIILQLVTNKSMGSG